MEQRTGFVQWSYYCSLSLPFRSSIGHDLDAQSRHHPYHPFDENVWGSGKALSRAHMKMLRERELHDFHLGLSLVCLASEHTGRR